MRSLIFERTYISLPVWLRATHVDLASLDDRSSSGESSRDSNKESCESSGELHFGVEGGWFVNERR